MKQLIRLWIACLWSGFIAVCACSTSVAVSQEGDKMTSGKIECDFEKVPEHAAMPDPCSPDIEDFDFEWRGIKINMPEKVAISGGANGVLQSEEMRIPVFILLQLTLDRLIKYEFEREGVTLIFVDRKTGKSFTENLLETGAALPVEKHEFSQQEMEQSVMRYFYNINALEFIELPEKSTTYDVYATFEEFKSNAMTITLK